MTDWADEVASRVLHSPTDIAMALRTERHLAKTAIVDLEAQLGKARDLARERLRTMKAERKASAEILQAERNKWLIVDQAMDPLAAAYASAGVQCNAITERKAKG